MPQGYSSDPPLDFPTSPNAVVESQDNFSWDFSSDIEMDTARPESLSTDDDEPGDKSLLMHEQEVEAESETDLSLRAEAKRAVLRIRLPAKLSRAQGPAVGQPSAVSAAKRARDVETSSASEAEETRSNSDTHHKRSKKKKRLQRKAEKKPESDAQSVAGSSEDELPVVAPPKPSRRRKEKATKKPVVTSEDSDSGDEPVAVKSPKRKRGRPRGSGKAKATAPKLEAVRRLNASVYVELAVPPKLIPGRTHKGDKLAPQKPKKYGPFTLTRSMTWERFLDEVSNITDIDLENLDISEMTWSFQRKTQLTLTGAGGYKAMVQQALALKDPSSAIIMVYLPMPRHHQRARQDSASDDERRPRRDVDHSPWGKKVSLDEELAPIMLVIDETYPIGKCHIHPDIQCYRYEVNDWHFHLDRNRVKVWANAILRKITDYTKPPLGSNFFLPKDRIGFNTHSQVTANPGPSTPASWDRGLAASPYGWPGIPFTPPAMPHMGWGAPPAYTPYGFNVPLASPHTPSAPPPPYYHHTPLPAPQIPVASGSHAPVASGSRIPVSSTNDGINEWCINHNLGDAEHLGLVKLGFIVGQSDALVALPMDMWEWAGLGPLHRQRILAACASAVPAPVI